MSNLFSRYAASMRRKANEADLQQALQVDYPNVKEVCELFDVTVLSDIHETENHVAACPKLDADGEECTCRPVPCYAIGWHSELSAGIRGGTITPWFDSMGELETFCAQRIEVCREIAKDEEGKIPDLSALEAK